MSIPYSAGEALTVQEIRELDVLAIEHVGIPGLVLMENAGRGAAEFIYGTLVNPAASRVVILCGAGNNGGDGFVIARHLRNAGVGATLGERGGAAVDVVLTGPPDKSQGDAGTNLRILQNLGCELVRADETDGLVCARTLIARADVIVDALLGTGSTGVPRGVMATLIELANTAPGARRIAIDIPSGLDADRGVVNEPCFRAAATVTMVAAKVGFDTPAARGVAGRVVVVDIGAPRELIPGRQRVGDT